MREATRLVLAVVCFAAIFTYGVIYYVGNQNAIDKKSTPQVDSVAIYKAINAFVKAKYVDIDFVTLATLTDSRWIAKEENRVFILASQSKFFENPLLGYASRYTKFKVAPVGPLNDSTVFDIELTELDMQGIAPLLSQSLPSPDNIELHEAEALIASALDSLVLSNPNLPAVVGSCQAVVVRDKCAYKIFPIDN